MIASARTERRVDILATGSSRMEVKLILIRLLGWIL